MGCLLSDQLGNNFFHRFRYTFSVEIREGDCNYKIKFSDFIYTLFCEKEKLIIRLLSLPICRDKDELEEGNDKYFKVIL